MMREPKEALFFSLFGQIAEKIQASAEALARLCEDLTDLDARAAEVKGLEKDTDILVQEVIKRLSAAKVTPLEPEDIHGLAIGLDDIEDFIESAADRIALYELSEPLPDLGSMAQMLVAAVREVRAAVDHLGDPSNGGDILSHCYRVRELEKQCDVALRTALRRLFKEGYDALEVIKWKEVVDQIEIATDKCEEVSNVLESIVVKKAAQ